MPEALKPRRVVVYEQVPYLVIPGPWRVGQATFWPGGMLERRLLSGTPGGVSDYVVEPLRANPTWATVRATGLTAVGRGREDWDAAAAQAAAKARDAIAALRLFVLASKPLLDTTRQTFGLATDIASVGVFTWFFDTHGRFVRSNAGHRGTLGYWEFTRQDVARFRADPRFRFLDAALRATDRTDWQHRIIAAVRTLTIATPLYRPATRIVLAATALEALFGEYAPGKPDKPPVGGPQLARRAAFLWCGSEAGNPHGPNRPACPFLTETSDRKLRHRLSELKAKGQTWACDYYADIRDLYEHRNAALHGAEDRFAVKTASSHEFTFERILVLVLGWVVATGAVSLADYEAAIAALPKP